MEALLDWFGHPERKFQAVLVAGTKGKGSTAKFFSSILTAHGYRAGLYTSPHLEDVRERIQIDGRMISKQAFSKQMSVMRPVIDRRKNEIPLLGTITFFEVLTLLSILHFAQEKVEFGVFEIGMGGRLDASNILESVLSMITPVSYDHEEYLGNTLTKIAREKAAIIRENGWVVSGVQEKAAKAVIRKELKQKRAAGFFLGSDFEVQRKRKSLNGSRFDFCFGRDQLKNLQIKLPGEFQIKNAAVAIAGIYVLNRRGLIHLQEKSVRKGLQTAFWPGRFEVIRQEKRFVILDGAHNGASMRELCKALCELRSGRRQVFILGVSRDKRLDRLLLPVREKASYVIATKSLNSRAQEPKVILEKMHELKFTKPMFWAQDIKEAIKMASRIASENTDIVITGSLFLVGEARKIVVHKCTGAKGHKRMALT
ncbi:MAG: hypothetical protein A3G33_05660 [Omnitrophica bacterium RIFCSPLOWO2_12_FULL_44_17]|uniref:Dihydrofolate synthase/folylpolyglutamate synthase n=1 Tax=Candidatus Danuiimicrobium aquiferis TaxID=1801832 RepID=A0A1G1L3W2_9BACT|nr:MAG: hypothetical protein A3B72_05140 [Omnitrophica bacterium RIFCSPHIGHO2_02_FULL_45_28]OGW92280.1 MAG: hypothetical protein A3E74_09345 [Omnitrophica bacterium RIFCSPHIGHO2_12_FULL_44_12]OGW99559.1 MAG: hypothetical protein A3G33_05660 [Omnitrophica bacterium RIFCSPLOWO2_12_FULL_44_17]OGX04008.1 MAG: hypothetical protein A3J12_06200 [Omnitrophica bacterium RIFCSPLOWO2_02_FULL_44_11]